MQPKQLFSLTLCIVVFSVGVWGELSKAEDGISHLKVEQVPTGGIHASGVFHVAADPSTLQAVITDYEHWPDLFDIDLRITKVERLEGRVLTELFVSHLLWPGDKRLLCENTEIPEGGLMTTRLEGDFKRYTRTWKMFPEKAGGSMRVEFELDMEIDTWAPDWIVAAALHDELEVHFQLVRERAEEIAAAKLGGKGELH